MVCLKEAGAISFYISDKNNHNLIMSKPLRGLAHDELQHKHGDEWKHKWKHKYQIYRLSRIKQKLQPRDSVDELFASLNQVTMF